MAFLIPDTRTIILLASALALLMSQAMALLSLALKGHRGPGFWAVGACGLALGSLLVALQDQLPALLGTVLGNSGTMASLCLVCHGLVIFVGQRGRLAVYLPVCLGTLLGFACFTLWLPSYSGRVVVFSLAYAYLMADTAYLLYRHQDNRREPSFIFVQVALLIPVAINALRITAILFLGPAKQGLIQSDPLGTLVLTIYLLNSVALFVGLIMLATSRFARRLEVANRSLERLSTQDGLTGLYNRRYLDQYLQREFQRAAREHAPLALILLDLDYFKAFNDTYGHLAGDDCLKGLARVMRGAARRPADLAARYGGEEFVMVLPGTDLAGALALAEGLRQAVQGLGLPHANSPVAGVVTVSLGVAAAWPQAGVSPADLLAQADQALYRAKDGGRNQVAAGQARPRPAAAPPSAPPGGPANA